jgi:hypothetical protein
MSSPFSGPSRFDYGLEEEAWVHHRKPEVTLGTLLEGEIRMVLDRLEAEEGKTAGEGWTGTGIM